jgi:dipeptidase E
MAERQILAAGGGKFCVGMARFLAGLTGQERPRVLYIGTASAESPKAALLTYDRFGPQVELSRLEFFPWPPADLRATMLDQDVVFVDGGNTANMLAIWRLHGVDELLREAYEAGVVLSGSSAGGICWFEQGVTDSFGPQLEAMDCLGFLPGSFCPHYDDEEQRRPRHRELLTQGLAPGYAADAGVGLLFVDGELRDVVACEEGSKAYRVEVRGREIVETPIEARVL